MLTPEPPSCLDLPEARHAGRGLEPLPQGGQRFVAALENALDGPRQLELRLGLELGRRGQPDRDRRGCRVVMELVRQLEAVNVRQEGVQEDQVGVLVGSAPAAVPPSVSWNWLKRTCFQARVSSARGYG